MNSDESMKELTEMIIEKLNNDVKALQKKALDALDAQDHKGCRKALIEQDEAIKNLIKITDTYNKRFS